MSGTFYLNAAARKLAIDQAVWKWTEIREDEKAQSTRCVFAPIVGVYKSGPKKGKQRLNTSASVECLVSDAEMKVERDRFIAEGGCVECSGYGKQWVSWSVEEGNKEETCAVCGGTGKVS